MTDIQTTRTLKLACRTINKSTVQNVDKREVEGRKYLHGLYYCNIYGNVFIFIALVNRVNYDIVKIS